MKEKNYCVSMVTFVTISTSLAVELYNHLTYFTTLHMYNLYAITHTSKRSFTMKELNMVYCLYW